MYATLESLKTWLRITDVEDDVDDDELTMALQVASAEIDHYCSQPFPLVGEDATTYTVVARQDRTSGQYIVDFPAPLTAEGGFTAYLWDGAAWGTEVAWSSSNLRPVGEGPYTSFVLPSDSGYAPDVTDPTGADATVQVNGYFGYDEVPAAVTQACLIQAARIITRRDAKFGIVNSLDGSSQTRLRSALDNDVAVMLRGYIRYWAAR